MITAKQLTDVLGLAPRFIEAEISEDRVTFLFSVPGARHPYVKVIIDPVDGGVRNPKLDVQVK